jgi:hypothetical protein
MMQYKNSMLKKPFRMGLSLIILLCFCQASLQAQLWLDYQLTVNGDTINRIDQLKRKQGPWVVRLEEVRGEPGYEEEGYYRHDKKEGQWRRFSLMGDLIARENYKGGYREGKQLYYTRLGDLLREEGWKSVDPTNPYDTIEVPDLDNPSKTLLKVIRHESAEVKHGVWNHYDPTMGTIIKTERFVFGQPEKEAPRNAAPKPAVPLKPVPKEIQEYEQKKKGKG